MFWVDGVHHEPALDQRFNNRAVRDLDCDSDLGCLARPTYRHQPGRHLGKPLTAVLEDPLADFSTISVREERMMALGRPVDAGVPLSLINHVFFPI